MPSQALKDWVDIAKNIFTTLGIIVGGVWTYHLFVRQRGGQTKGKVTLSVEQFPTGAGHTFLRAVLLIENKGTVKISPPRVSTTLQYVLPVVGELRDDIANGRQVVPDNDYEVPWPVAEEYDVNLLEDDWELEPGEAEKLFLDFLVPSNVELVQVHAMLYETTDEESHYWDDAALVKMQ